MDSKNYILSEYAIVYLLSVKILLT